MDSTRKAGSASAGSRILTLQYRPHASLDQEVSGYANPAAGRMVQARRARRCRAGAAVGTQHVPGGIRSARTVEAELNRPGSSRSAGQRSYRPRDEVFWERTPEAVGRAGKTARGAGPRGQSRGTPVSPESLIPDASRTLALRVLGGEGVAEYLRTARCSPRRAPAESSGASLAAMRRWPSSCASCMKRTASRNAIPSPHSGESVDKSVDKSTGRGGRTSGQARACPAYLPRAACRAGECRHCALWMLPVSSSGARPRPIRQRLR